MAQKLGDPPYSTFGDVNPEVMARVSECLERIAGNPEDASAHIPGLTDLASEHGLSQVLTPFLDSENDGKRLYVASTLLSFSTLPEHAVAGDTVRKCEVVLVRSLEHVSPQIRYMGSRLLAQNDLPKRAIIPLRKQMRGTDAKLTTIAAIALSRSHDAEPEAFQILVGCLTSVKAADDEITALAVVALLRMGIRSREALDAIKKRFNRFPPFVLRHVLKAAFDIGPQASGLFDLMVALLTNNSEASRTRCLCAAAIGSVARGSERATALLIDALRSSDRVVLEGAAIGLEASGNIPAVVCDVLADRLTEPDVELRRAAAEAVQTLGQSCAPMIPVLIRRLSEETDQSMLAAVARALARMGKPAVKALIECLDHGNLQIEAYVGSALVTIGRDAAEEIADVIIGDDLRKFQVLLRVLESMGSNAAPALPTVTMIFENIHEDYLLIQVARILFFCGPAATSAIPALVHHVAQRFTDGNDVDFWVKQTLLCHPSKAVHELRGALKTATGSGRRRLEAMLAEFDSKSTLSSKRLIGFPHVTRIRQFVVMGDMLAAHGPCSMRKLGNLLKAAPPTKEGNRRGLSTATLQRAVDALEAWVNEPLTVRSEKNAVSLTAEGQALLQECKEFLESIDRSSPA